MIISFNAYQYLKIKTGAPTEVLPHKSSGVGSSLPLKSRKKNGRAKTLPERWRCPVARQAVVIHGPPRGVPLPSLPHSFMAHLAAALIQQVCDTAK